MESRKIGRDSTYTTLLEGQRGRALNSTLLKFWSAVVRISAATALLACWLDLNFPGGPGVVLYTVFGVVPAVLEFWLACIAFGAYLGAKRALRG